MAWVDIVQSNSPVPVLGGLTQIRRIRAGIFERLVNELFDGDGVCYSSHVRVCDRFCR
jgi:hypothetical protein